MAGIKDEQGFKRLDFRKTIDVNEKFKNTVRSTKLKGREHWTRGQHFSEVSFDDYLEIFKQEFGLKQVNSVFFALTNGKLVEDLELIDSFIQILGKDFRKYQKQFQHKSVRSKKNYEALICIEMCSNFADDQVFEDSCEINIEVNEFSKTNSGLPYDGIRNCELTSNSTVFLCTGWFCKNTAQTI